MRSDHEFCELILAVLHTSLLNIATGASGALSVGSCALKPAPRPPFKTTWDLFLKLPSELSSYPKLDNEVRELATAHLHWQQCANPVS